jgi:hypothetical protein
MWYTFVALVAHYLDVISAALDRWSWDLVAYLRNNGYYGE